MLGAGRRRGGLGPEARQANVRGQPPWVEFVGSLTQHVADLLHAWEPVHQFPLRRPVIEASIKEIPQLLEISSQSTPIADRQGPPEPHLVRVVERQELQEVEDGIRGFRPPKRETRFTFWEHMDVRARLGKGRPRLPHIVLATIVADVRLLGLFCHRALLLFVEGIFDGHVGAD